MRKKPWHARPVLAPVVYCISMWVVGAMAYTCGYLLTGSIRHGLYMLALVDGLLLLYLLECARTAEEKEEERERDELHR